MKEFFDVPRTSFIKEVLQWNPTDTEEQYLKAKEEHSICYGPNDIVYSYNNYGFRCEDFEPWNMHPYRILFTGCSMTEGIGLPLEHVWAKVMHNKICDSLAITMPFWNIGIGNTGLDQMIRYLYHFGDLLRPQLIISNLPELKRREFWNEKSPLFNPSSLAEANATVKVVFDDKFVKYQTEKNFAMLNLLLDKWNSYFIFVTHESNVNISYLSDHIPRIKQFVLSNGPTCWDLARDGIHAGPEVNKFFAEEFFNSAETIIREKLNVNRI